MKKLVNLSVLSSVAFMLLFTSCKKDEEIDKKVETGTTLKQNDQSGSSEADQGIEDVNNIISNNIGNGGPAQRVAAYDLPCGVVKIDSSASTNGKKIYRVQYGSNTPCGYKKKSGEISFNLINGTHFRDSNAVVAVTFKDYVVEVLATNQTVKLNGTIYTTNLTGGYVWQTILDPSSQYYKSSISHRLRGTFQITYHNGEVRSRSYYQLRTWTSLNSWQGLSFTADGDTTIGGVKVSETGKTYEGNYNFYTEIIQALRWENCGTTYAGPYVLKSGNAKLNVTDAGISPAYFQVEAGYRYDIATPANTPVKTNNCESNAYKITTLVGTTSSTQYQLY
jgi:hypothetical protein